MMFQLPFMLFYKKKTCKSIHKIVKNKNKEKVINIHIVIGNPKKDLTKIFSLEKFNINSNKYHNVQFVYQKIFLILSLFIILK